MSCHTKRIAVLMINTPKNHSYGHLASHINYKYCSKHHYTFLMETCPRKEDMKKDWMWDDNNQYVIVWSKITLIKRHLPHYDYLFYIDSDAVFTNQENTIENFVQKHVQNKDTCIIAGEDCLKRDHCWAKNGLNAGTLLFVNRPQTFKILDHWFSAMDKECADWKYVHTREQMCLQILLDKYYKKHIKIIPYDEMNGLDGKWIQHYMQMTNEERIKYMSPFFHKFFEEECHIPVLSSTSIPSLLEISTSCPPLKTTVVTNSTDRSWFFYVVFMIFIIMIACMMVRKLKILNQTKKR